MSQFNPTMRTVLPDNDPDHLSGAVVASLTRPLYSKLSWGVGLTLLWTFLSAGIVPVVAMTRWLRGIIAQQEQQLWHLSEWLGVNFVDSDVGELQSAAQQVRFNVPLATMSFVLVCVAAAAAAKGLINPRSYQTNLYQFAFHTPRSAAAVVFTAALSAAALCNCIHLAWHQHAVERFLRYFNHVAERRGLEPMPLPALEMGLSPGWIIAGLIVAGSGALWGILVMLAAGAHRRYTVGTSVRTRSMLAERVQTVLQNRRPAMRVPQPVVAVRVCVRPNCRAPLPWSAGYCPRCGTQAASAMNVVA